ncbi:protein of unknown function [Bradyrhizobium vignae]|uniref:Uncharacterized protein n=1 Tax=Bradyrhizobium vignae TaxID=1549949 RepID=A0A2U3Q0Z0_9BRAD|nr:protein of unknown function [Bradyrhizobium vignae]
MPGQHPFHDGGDRGSDRANDDAIAESREAQAIAQHRHCERSEAIQNLFAEGFWIASSQGLLAMTEQGARPSLATLFKQQTNVRLLAAQLARVLLRVPPSQRQGRREGRAPAGTRKSVRYEKCTRGGPQVLPDRPAFPAQWFDGLCRALVSRKSARMCERAVLAKPPVAGSEPVRAQRP